jgi:hypothetical protein
MEGYPAQNLINPAGYSNQNTPYYFPQPYVTGILTNPTEIYVATNGNDNAENVGSITTPFQTITAAVQYVNDNLIDPGLGVLNTPVCIFVAPGEYVGGFTLTEFMYLIGATMSNSKPTEATSAVQIEGLPITIAAVNSNTAVCRLQNLLIHNGSYVSISNALITSNVELVNCTLKTTSAQSVLAFNQLDGLVFINVVATNCDFIASNVANLSLISSEVSERSFLTLDSCRLTSDAQQGSVIIMRGSLDIKYTTITNTAVSTNNVPLIRSISGSSLVPTVNLLNSSLTVTDLTPDSGGNKFAVEFDAGAQNINALMTNNTMSIFRGNSQTNIIRNIGAGQVTLSQSANSCLLDGKTIDTTNLVLTAAFFLQDSPLPPPPAGGVSYLNSLEGSVTLSGGDGITVGTVGDTITVTNTGALSVAGASGAITLTGTNVAITVVDENIDLAVTFPAIPVTSVGAKTGDVTFAAGEEGGLALAYGMNNADPITISNTGVITIESITGNVTLSTTTTGLTIVPTGQDIAIDVTFPVTSVNSKTGDVTFASGDGIQLDPGMDPADPIYIINSGILSVSAGTGILTETTSGATTVSAIARPYTLLGATTGGVVTNVIGTGSGNNFTQATFELVSTIQINVPPGWSGGQSVMFDGFAYYNFSSTVNSFWAIYYVTSTQPTEEALIGTKTVGNSIAAPGAVSQIYLPMNLTIPPDHLEDAGTITIRVYGYVTTTGEHLSSDPLIDGRVGIVYP